MDHRRLFQLLVDLDVDEGYRLIWVDGLVRAGNGNRVRLVGWSAVTFVSCCATGGDGGG